MLSDVRMRYLYEAARLGTMNAASERLNVATSSISRQIAKLEEELGIALIEKERRKIRLTEAGEAIYQYYLERVSQEEAFLSRIQDLRYVRSGKIVLAVGEAFVTQKFSDMLDAYMRRFPGIEVTVAVANTNQVVSRVLEDQAHLGLIFDIPREPRIRARLTIPQPLKVIATHKHPLARAGHIRLADLRDESLGLPDEGYRIRQLIRTAEQEEGVFLHAALATNSLMLLTDYVKSGRGISLLPELVVHEDLRRGTLVALATDSPILNGTKTSLITRVGRQLPMGAYRLMLSVEAHLKEVAGAPEAG
jgi:DNA-binding transcriptional LysR family regulator